MTEKTKKKKEQDFVVKTESFSLIRTIVPTFFQINGTDIHLYVENITLK
jgi:hypothetical protein